MKPETDEVEITPAMIGAGSRVIEDFLAERDPGGLPDSVLAEVYKAMSRLDPRRLRTRGFQTTERAAEAIEAGAHRARP